MEKDVASWSLLGSRMPLGLVKCRGMVSVRMYVIGFVYSVDGEGREERAGGRKGRVILGEGNVLL